jgi:pilus assembly protein CpaE
MASPTTLAELHDLRSVSPATVTVLAFGKRPSASIRDVVRVGAADIMTQPFTIDDLARVLDQAARLNAMLDPFAATTSSSKDVATSSGRVFSVASATGGCGKTFFATNIAYFLATQTNKRVCIVDLDLQFGEVSTALRLKPRFTVADLITSVHEGASIDEHLEDHLVRHETGIWVLPAPKDPAEADCVAPRDVTMVIEALRTRFDFVVVDTPGQLAETVLAAFDQSELLYIMATLDLPSIRNMGVFLTTLDRLRIPSDQVRLILNKAESDIGLEALEVERLFPQGFTATLPYAKEVHRSINLGTPVLAAAPNAPITRNLMAGVRELLPEERRAAIPDAVVARKNGWFQRLLGPKPEVPMSASANAPAMEMAQ